MDRKYFCRICSCFPTGVTVATLTGDDGQPHGITVSSFTSVSLDPALVLICIDHRSHMVRYLDPGRPFAINVLSSAQREISNRFAGQWENRFAGVAWHPGVTGAPLLYGAAASLECSLDRSIAAGDHMIVLGQVVSGSCTDLPPLLYVRSSYSNAITEHAGAGSAGVAAGERH